MAYIKPYQLPALTIIILQLAFLGSYIAAVLQEHIVPTVSYISDGGAKLPESSVFGTMLNIGSVFTVAVVYIRYLQVAQLYKSYTDKLDVKLNKYNEISFPFGIIMSMGVSVVANFQVCNVRSVHLSGAFAAFGFGTIYLWLQVFVSYKLEPFAGTRRKAHIRLVLVIACTLLFFLQTITGVMSHEQFKGEDTLKWVVDRSWEVFIKDGLGVFVEEEPLQHFHGYKLWKYPSDGGWHFHVVSSVSEWIVATIFSFFILSFTEEFRDVEIEHPQVNIAAYRITL